MMTNSKVFLSERFQAIAEKMVVDRGYADVEAYVADLIIRDAGDRAQKKAGSNAALRADSPSPT